VIVVVVSVVVDEAIEVDVSVVEGNVNIVGVVVVILDEVVFVSVGLRRKNLNRRESVIIKIVEMIMEMKIIERCCKNFDLRLFVLF